MITRPRSLARVSTLAAVATASASSAQAAIIVKNTTPFTSDDFTIGEVYWDIDGNGVKDALIRNFQSSISSNTYFSHKLMLGNGDFKIKGDGKMQKLSAGAVIDAASGFTGIANKFFQSGSINPLVMTGGFISGESALIGFRFSLLSGGPSLYGWANVTATNGDGYGTFTINNWAYEDIAGASILAGQTVATAVPEPAAYAAGLGALALGAAALRRRRQNRVVPA
jgi:MYXO-CTERM domain-containing protein